MCGRFDYGKETDMWSLGIIFYQLLARRIPFESYSKAFSLQKIMYEDLDLDFVTNWFSNQFTRKAQSLLK